MIDRSPALRHPARSPARSYVVAALAVSLVGGLTLAFLPWLGLASCALLFQLPVLLAAVEGGLGPGLMAAVLAAFAYNFLLLPPQFSLRIHEAENIVSVVVLIVVAYVSSRLATALRLRELEASQRADASGELAELSAALNAAPPVRAIEHALAFLTARYGRALFLPQDEIESTAAAFNSLEHSAAAWSMHNGDMTGHGTQIMPEARWTFLPLAPRRPGGGPIVALGQPGGRAVRAEGQLAHLQQLCRLIGQAADRLALEQARLDRQRLEDRDRLRRALLASLGHDFRTPLTVVMGELESLDHGQSAVVRALAAARRLDRKMDDLVGVTRIEHGGLAPARDAIDLVDVVADACAAVAPDPGNIALQSHIAPDLPFVAGDAVLLRHVLVNLIDNALRHARSQVTIDAGTSGGNVWLSMSDDGPGVPPAQAAAVFERFARIEGSDRSGGSGLGLAIVKGFADAMAMEIAITDAPGGGACFTLTMPARAMDGA
ncbi:ATP-binding protein [Novosphingobium lentum]|uniref:ATP-binding protein n=1 Tax=Novosphingobium lentum TaxID=145287 RepID=UPI000833B246|nr:ATP-binding protein [Novosphingobium lentum]